MAPGRPELWHPVRGYSGKGTYISPQKYKRRPTAALFVFVVINYLDRANLSIAAPLLAKDLAIDSVKMGLVFSAFGWSYVICQVPGGWLVDRLHPRSSTPH